MSLIDTSYFQGPLNIAQKGQPSVSEDLQNYIDRYEPEFMINALGYDLYNDFNLAINPVNPDDPIDQKWKDIRDGVIFKNTAGWWPNFSAYHLLYDSNQNTIWVGFKSKIASQSPIAGYVYDKYMRDLVTQNTGIGVVKNKGDGSVSARPNFKMADRWNDMCDSVYTLWQFLQTKGNSVYSSYNQGYINHHEFSKMNVFGI